MKVTIFIFALFALSTIVSGFFQARTLNTTLPYPLSDPISVYDEDDNIYLFGGYDRDFRSLRTILKFTISTETFIELPDILSVTTYGAAGAACLDTLNSEIFLITSFLQDGVGYYTEVFRLPTNSDNQTVINAGRHRIGTPYSYTFCDHTGRVFDVSYYSGVLRYHQNLNLFQAILPNNNLTRNGAVVYDHDSDVAYIFGGVHYPTPNNEIIKFTPGPPATVEVLEATLPAVRTEGVSAWDGKYAYVSAGVNSYYNSMYRFDPETGEVTTIEVLGFPEGDYRNSATSSVYVPKTNSIYVFGGTIRQGEFSNVDTAWTISLDEEDFDNQ